MQQDDYEKARLEAQIYGELIGGAGIGAVGKKAGKETGKAIEEAIKNVDDHLTPKPATVAGTPDVNGGATTMTGNPDVSRGLGKTEVAGATMAAGYDQHQNPQGIYDPQGQRADLEAVYGAENVSSTTVPPNNLKNVKLAGQRHPVTGIIFDQRGYPIFDNIARYDTQLINKGFNNLTYNEQMQLASKDLWGAIQRGEVNSSQFTSSQLKQIKNGNSKVEGYTWHHHQDQGRMQLVPTWEHSKTGHIGGDAMKDGK